MKISKFLCGITAATVLTVSNSPFNAVLGVTASSASLPVDTQMSVYADSDGVTVKNYGTGTYEKSTDAADRSFQHQLLHFNVGKTWHDYNEGGMTWKKVDNEKDVKVEFDQFAPNVTVTLPSGANPADYMFETHLYGGGKGYSGIGNGILAEGKNEIEIKLNGIGESKGGLKWYPDKDFGSATLYVTVISPSSSSSSSSSEPPISSSTTTSDKPIEPPVSSSSATSSKPESPTDSSSGDTSSEPAESTPTEDVIYTPENIDGSFDSDITEIIKDITVTAVSGAIENGAVLTVKPDLSYTKTGCAFDITFTKDGKKIQPNSAVNVQIPIPEELKGKKIYVYHSEDGKFTPVDADINDDYVKFSASHFSIYVITNEKLDSANEPVVNNPGTGIAFTIVPVVLTASAILVIVKKKK